MNADFCIASEAIAFIAKSYGDYQFQHPSDRSTLKSNLLEPKLHTRCFGNGCLSLPFSAKFKNNDGRRADGSQQVSSQSGQYPSSREGAFTGMSEMSGDTRKEVYSAPLPTHRQPITPDAEEVRHSSRLTKAMNRLVRPLRGLSRGNRNKTPQDEPSSDFVRRTQPAYVFPTLYRNRLAQRRSVTFPAKHSQSPGRGRSGLAKRFPKAGVVAGNLPVRFADSRFQKKRHLRTRSEYPLSFQKRSSIGSVRIERESDSGIVEPRGRCGGKGCFPNPFKGRRRQRRPSSPPQILPNLPIPTPDVDTSPSAKNAQSNVDQTSPRTLMSMPISAVDRDAPHSPKSAFYSAGQTTSGKHSSPELAQSSSKGTSPRSSFKTVVKNTRPRSRWIDFWRDIPMGEYRGEALVRFHSDPLPLHSNWREDVPRSRPSVLGKFLRHGVPFYM